MDKDDIEEWCKLEVMRASYQAIFCIPNFGEMFNFPSNTIHSSRMQFSSNQALMMIQIIHTTFFLLFVYHEKT